MFIAILIIIFILWLLISLEIKRIKEPNVFCITGGVKTGKTALLYHLGRKRYKRQVLKWRIKKIFHPIKNKNLEKPLFYTNVPVGWAYVPVTKELLTRRERFVFGSVCCLQEASLIADSMDFTDKELNNELKEFFKLFGHETRGGYLFFDTQNLKDVHYNIKRSLCSYLWIHTKSWRPFFHKLTVREMFYSDEQGVINVFNEDIEEQTKVLYVPKNIHKKYDSYCYSALTDHLKKNDKIILTKERKTKDILTFKEVKKNDKIKK